MSYDPTNWKAGDVISSQKLNKLEQGVADAGGGGGALVVHIQKEVVSEEKTHFTADKTAGEIKAALESGQGVVIPFVVETPVGTMYNVSYVSLFDGTSSGFSYDSAEGVWVLFVVSDIADSTADLSMRAATLDDYPYAEEGGK